VDLWSSDETLEFNGHRGWGLLTRSFQVGSTGAGRSGDLGLVLISRILVTDLVDRRPMNTIGQARSPRLSACHMPLVGEQRSNTIHRIADLYGCLIINALIP